MKQAEREKTRAQEMTEAKPNKDLQYYLGLHYPIEIVEDEDAFVATVPELPGCVSYGDTIDEAVRGAKATKELWIKGRLDAGQGVPEPVNLEDFSGKFVLRIPRGLHRQLDREAAKEGVSLNQHIGHLLSDRHRVTRLEEMLSRLVSEASAGQSEPLFENSRWCGQPRMLHFHVHHKPTWIVSMATPEADQMLGMLQYMPKPPKMLHGKLRKSEREVLA